MLSKPSGQFGLIHRSRGDSLHRTDRGGLLKRQLQPLIRKKHAGSNPGRSFVAVDETMIPGEAIRVRGGQVRCIWILVGRKMLGPSQGGFDKSLVSYSIQSAVFRELAIMKCIDERRTQPTPRSHFARTLRTSRSSCMMPSAKAIWRSKSGSKGVSR